MIRKIIIGISVFLILIAGIVAWWATWGIDAGRKLIISNVDLATIKDGTNNGKYENGRFSNEVSVTVKDHKITKINSVKDMSGAGSKISKEIFDRVIQNQNLNIDTVSGVTATTKGYLKAIENALR